MELRRSLALLLLHILGTMYSQYFALAEGAMCDPPCHNGGICADGNVCYCRAPFTGRSCEESPNCNPPCQNGGECMAGNTCKCPASFSGRRCEESGKSQSPSCVDGWTEYFNTDHPATSTMGDDETLERITESHSVCPGGIITDVNCVANLSGFLIDYRRLSTFGVRCSKEKGLVCSSHIRQQSCEDYAVRFLCECRTDGDKSDVHSPSRESSPDSAFVGSLNPKNSDSQSNRECSCTYDYDDNFAKAQIGQKKLKRGDKIMRGETVSFACKFSGVLSWQNGFRFFGKANMTCNSCEKWQSKDLPTCSDFAKIDAVIGNEEDLKILPGGIVDLRKGDSYRFFCSSIWRQPQWEYGEKMGVEVNKTQAHGPGRLIFVSYLDIMQAGHEHNGTYECFMQGQFRQKVGSSFLNVRVDAMYCSVPPDPVNGRVRYSSLEYGTELRYECDVGYMLQHHEPRICSEDGSWSNEEPECIEAKCEAPRRPAHGSVKLHGELKVGSLATYSCDPGKSLHGAATTKCLITGQWTFDAPQCLSSCSVPSIQNGETGRIVIRTRRWRAREEFVKVYSGAEIHSNEVLILRCRDGFSPAKDSRILEKNQLEVKCIDGTWSSSLQCYENIRCEKLKATDLLQIDYSSDREVGSIAAFHCHSATKRIGVPFAKCLENGTWAHPTPACEYLRCVVHKLTSSLPEGVVLADNTKNTSFPYDSTVKLTCDDYHKILEGNSEARCAEEGEWKFGPIQCGSHCKFPRQPPDSKLILSPEKAEYVIGDRLTFSCPPGMNLTAGSQMIMCLPSGWSETVLPDCRKSES